MFIYFSDESLFIVVGSKVPTFEINCCWTFLSKNNNEAIAEIYWPLCDKCAIFVELFVYARPLYIVGYVYAINTHS